MKNKVDFSKPVHLNLKKDLTAGNLNKKEEFRNQVSTNAKQYHVEPAVKDELTKTYPGILTQKALFTSDKYHGVNYTINELLKIIKQKDEEISNLNKSLSEMNSRSASLLVNRELQLTEVKEKNRELLYEISTRQKSEELLKKSNETKDRFFSIIAHDLRNPVAAIVGMLSLINEESDSFSKEEIIELIRDLHSNAENTQNLLENLLNWSKSQTGLLQVVHEVCKLKPLVDEAIASCENIAVMKSIVIKLEVDENIKICTDKNMVGTIIRNLLSNAIKFSETDGEVTISSSIKNGFVKLSIKDKGIGINANNLKKLFEPENKITSLGTANEKGSGLGLILCKEFIEKIGGEMLVTSTPDIGSTFSFTMQGA